MTKSPRRVVTCWRSHGCCSSSAKILANAMNDSGQRPELRTAADVYYHGYFDPGRYGDFNSRGLLGQALTGIGEEIGLEEGQPPDRENYQTRIDRAACLLGAIAFEMLAAYSKGTNPDATPDEVDASDLGVFREKVVKRLQDAGQGSRMQFFRDYARLTKTNNQTVEFLLFSQGKQGVLGLA